MIFGAAFGIFILLYGVLNSSALKKKSSPHPNLADSMEKKKPDDFIELSDQLQLDSLCMN